MGTQKVCYADEAIYVAGRFKNVFLETGWGPLPRLKEAYQSLGASKLLLGSDCPIQEIGSQIRVIEVLGWPNPMGLGISEKDIEKILGENAVQLFHLE
jgi:predicted TIM-barrel fold metal-dependent hydrolase